MFRVLFVRRNYFEQKFKGSSNNIFEKYRSDNLINERIPNINNQKVIFYSKIYIE